MNNFLSKYLNALLNARKIDVALFTFSHIWLSNVSSEPSQYYFPDSLYLNSSVFSTLAIFICLHFSGWNFSNQVLLQFSGFSKSSCKIYLSSPSVMFLKILVSSANKYTSDFTSCVQSCQCFWIVYS
jgi:hypothetical protein